MSPFKRVALLIAATLLFAMLDVVFAIGYMFVHSKLWLGRVDITAYHTAAVLVWPMVLGGLVSCAGLYWVWKRSGEDRASPLQQSLTDPR
jgi:hypothetical protein